MMFRGLSAILIVTILSTTALATEIVQRYYQYDYEGIAKGVKGRTFIICEECSEEITLNKPIERENNHISLAIRVPSPIQSTIKSQEHPVVCGTCEAVNIETSNPTILKSDNREKNNNPLIVYFDYNSSYLNRTEKEKLLKKVSELQGKTVTVIGYTDHVGSKKYNDWLALRRAKRVASILIRNQVSVKDIKGKGKCCYISSDQPCLNRRVEVLVEEKN